MKSTSWKDTSEGIRADIRIGMPGSCPVAAASEQTNATAGSVTRSVPSDGAVTEDFTINSETSLDDPEMTPVFRGDTTTYRFERQQSELCACEEVEQFGLPVTDICARDGALILTLHVPGMEMVKDIVEMLREHFDDISVVHLSQSQPADAQDLVFVDRGRFTDRQLEVLETAHEMGYFTHPKGANAGDVARALDIAPSTLAEHVAAAESKIMDAILER